MIFGKTGQVTYLNSFIRKKIIQVYTYHVNEFRICSLKLNKYIFSLLKRYIFENKKV